MSSGDQWSACAVCGQLLGHRESKHAGDAEQAEALQFWLAHPNYSPVEGKDCFLFMSGNIILGRGATAYACLIDAVNNRGKINKNA
jgi:hypothetical protein